MSDQPIKAEGRGCKCSQCPLKSAPGPLLPAAPKDATTLVLLDHPRDTEIAQRRHLAGAGGQMLADLLRPNGFPATNTIIAFAVACQPPDNDLAVAEAKAKLNWRGSRRPPPKPPKGATKAERAAYKEALAEWEASAPPDYLTAAQCCAPAYAHLIPTTRQIIAAGPVAWQTLTGREGGVGSVSGSPFYARLSDSQAPLVLLPPEPGTMQAPEGATHRVVPTYAPSYAAFKRVYRFALETAVRRAAKFFRGALVFPLPVDTHLAHQDAEGHEVPGCSVQQLSAFFDVPNPEDYWWSDDIETEHSKYTEAQSRLQCTVYLWGATRLPKDNPDCRDSRAATVVFAFKDLHGHPVHDSTVADQAVQIISAHLASSRHSWVGQNAGNFESTIYLERWGVKVPNRVDTKVLHWACFPGAPHDLGYIGSTLTDAPSWKVDFETGGKLAKIENNAGMAGWIYYNAMDHAVTGVAAVALMNRLRSRQGDAICPEWQAQQRMIEDTGSLPPGVKPYPFKSLPELWAFKQDCAVQFQRQGLPLDVNVIRALYVLLKREEAHYLALVKKHLGDINPASSQQLARVLFGAPPVGWGLEPQVFTDTGMPSTSDDALKELLREGLLPDQVAALRAVILYRRVSAKWIGTYVWPLHPDNPDKVPYDSPIYVGKQYAGTKYAGTDYPPHLRASWNSEGTPVNRFACSDPANLQTIPNGGNLVHMVGTVMDQELYDLLKMCRIKPKRIGDDGKEVAYAVGDLIKHPIEINFRKMVAVPEGFVLGGADADQAHLRIAASLWGIKKLLKTFELGGCPHAVATALLSEAFRNRALPGFPKLRDDSDEAREYFILAEGEKWKGPAKAERQTGKTFQYTALYEGAAHAIAVVLWGMESPSGELPLLVGKGALSLRHVQAFRRKWLKGMPEFEAGWESTIKLALTNRDREASRLRLDPLRVPAWLTDPVAGQRMDFWGSLDGNAGDEIENDRNKAINFRVLASEQAIMQAALHRLLRLGCGWEEWGPGTGPLIQIHDSLTSMAPETVKGPTGAVYDMSPGGDATDKVLVPARTARENTGRWLAELHGEAITTRLLTLPGVVHSGSGVWGDTLADA